MNGTEYIELASRTSTEDGAQVHLERMEKIDRTDFDRVFNGFAAASKAAEHLKKQIHYGRDLPRTPSIIPSTLNCPFTPTDLHANLGVMGEAQEFVESITREKVLDEGGDMLWYIAKKFKAYGITFEEAFDFNIEKLKARYPERYTDEQALAPRKEIT